MLCKTRQFVKFTLLKRLRASNKKGILIAKGNVHLLLPAAVLPEIITCVSYSVRLEVTVRSQQIEEKRRRNLIKKAIMESRTIRRQSQMVRQRTLVKMKLKLITKGKKVSLGTVCSAVSHC